MQWRMRLTLLTALQRFEAHGAEDDLRADMVNKSEAPFAQATEQTHRLEQTCHLEAHHRDAWRKNLGGIVCGQRLDFFLHPSRECRTTGQILVTFGNATLFSRPARGAACLRFFGIMPTSWFGKCYRVTSWSRKRLFCIVASLPNRF